MLGLFSVAMPKKSLSNDLLPLVCMGSVQDRGEHFLLIPAVDIEEPASLPKTFSAITARPIA